MFHSVSGLDSEAKCVLFTDEGRSPRPLCSDADLDILLDRSPAAFAREKGWSAGLGKVGVQGREEKIRKGEKTAFEVS